MATMTKKKVSSRRSLSAMPKFFPEINRRIAQLRQQKGLTFQEMADQLGITIETLQAIEGLRVNPNIYIIKQVHRVCEVSYDWLLDGVVNTRKST